MRTAQGCCVWARPPFLIRTAGSLKTFGPSAPAGVSGGESLQQPLRGGHLAHQLWCHGPLAMCSSKKGFSFLRWQLQVSSPLSCLSREPAL